jgi:hypothetical protein
LLEQDYFVKDGMDYFLVFGAKWEPKIAQGTDCHGRTWGPCKGRSGSP